jgi:hypothetical protein
MSLLIERIRLRDSSDSRIMPSVLSYSNRCTYAPISCIDVTCAGAPTDYTWCQSRAGGTVVWAAAHLDHDDVIDLREFTFIHSTVLVMCRHGDARGQLYKRTGLRDRQAAARGLFCKVASVHKRIPSGPNEHILFRSRGHKRQLRCMTPNAGRAVAACAHVMTPRK